jgi:hypothetical protein
MLLVAWRLPHNLESTQVSTDAPKVNTKAFQLRRVDFLGAILLAISIVAFLLVLNFASKRLTILDPVVLALCGLWAGSSLLFLLVEAKYASEPIFPLQLLVRRDVLTAYLITGLMIMGQMSVTYPFRVRLFRLTRFIQMFSSVALYFRVTERASNAVSSAHLLPAVVGNAIGSLLAGKIIKRLGTPLPTFANTLFDFILILNNLPNLVPDATKSLCYSRPCFRAAVFYFSFCVGTVTHPSRSPCTLQLAAWVKGSQ